LDDARRWFCRTAELARDTYDDNVRADALKALNVARERHVAGADLAAAICRPVGARTGSD